MLSPNKICTNCAPVFFEYYQKGLETQSKILHMRDELERLSFNKQLGTLKDVSDVDISISQNDKFQLNSRLGGKRSFALNLTQKENSILDKQGSVACNNTTMLRSCTPAGKYTSKSLKDQTLHNKSQDILKSMNNLITPTIGTISPLERLRDFENQVNKKVDSFKKRLREEVAKSAKRNSFSKNLPLRPKTTGKALRTLGDDENKSAPKVSRFSPGGEGKSPILSPIQFKFTPRLDRKEKPEKGSGPSLAEWTVGTMKDQRNNITHFRVAEKGFSPERINLDSPFKKVKDTLKKDLEAIQIISKDLPSPDEIKLHSPLFSPLRASQLTSPNIQQGHPKTDEHKKDYKHFIKPHSTPLLDSIMSSSREAEKDSKSLIPTQGLGSSSEDKSTGKLGSFKSNYYKELFSTPLDDSPSSKLVKTDKVPFANHSATEDEMQTVHEPPKFHHFQNSSLSGSKRKERKMTFEQKTRADDDDFEKLLQGNTSYDRTQKKAYDFFKPMKGHDTVPNQDRTWYIPVNVKGGKFYSTDDNVTEYKIGEANSGNKLTSDNGILVHSTPADALKSQLLSPRLDSAPKILLEVKVQGPFKKVDNSSSLYSSIMPVRAIYNDFDDLSL